MTDTSIDTQAAPRLLDGWLSEAEAARQLNLTTRQLREHRKVANGIPYRKFGKKVFYHAETFREWFQAGLTRPNPTR